MNLQTHIRLEPQKFNQIDYSSKLLLIGSCFSEKIGSKFKYYKFQSLVNPFGILFHPLAIENLISKVINEYCYSEEELIHYDEIWSCYDVHSRLNSLEKQDLINNLNSQLELTNQQIKESTHIVITLGTAWIYRHIASDKIVANCHKVPQKQFLKELLSIDQIIESLKAIISLVRQINPKVSFIFAVSPVRHIKDGFIENTRSKSHLLAAIHQVVDSRKQYYYFPSYEVVMDELRDYRFYKSDMLHPNDLAIDYIWKKFKEVWISKGSDIIMKEVDVIQKGLKHKPFNIESEAHKIFLTNLQSRIKDLCEKYPTFNFNE